MKVKATMRVGDEVHVINEDQTKMFGEDKKNF